MATASSASAGSAGRLLPLLSPPLVSSAKPFPLTPLAHQTNSSTTTKPQTPMPTRVSVITPRKVDSTKYTTAAHSPPISSSASSPSPAPATSKATATTTLQSASTLSPSTAKTESKHRAVSLSLSPFANAKESLSPITPRTVAPSELLAEIISSSAAVSALSFSSLTPAKFSVSTPSSSLTGNSSLAARLAESLNESLLADQIADQRSTAEGEEESESAPSGYEPSPALILCAIFLSFAYFAVAVLSASLYLSFASSLNFLSPWSALSVSTTYFPGRSCMELTALMSLALYHAATILLDVFPVLQLCCSCCRHQILSLLYCPSLALFEYFHIALLSVAMFIPFDLAAHFQINGGIFALRQELVTFIVVTFLSTAFILLTRHFLYQRKLLSQSGHLSDQQTYRNGNVNVTHMQANSDFDDSGGDSADDLALRYYEFLYRAPDFPPILQLSTMRFYLEVLLSFLFLFLAIAVWNSWSHFRVLTIGVILQFAALILQRTALLDVARITLFACIAITYQLLLLQNSFSATFA